MRLHNNVELDYFNRRTEQEKIKDFYHHVDNKLKPVFNRTNPFNSCFFFPVGGFENRTPSAKIQCQAIK